MNEQTRYRLTGAIFLLSIGIIVLPMIFDGEGVRVKQLPELSEPLPPTPTQSELAALEISQPEIEQHRAEQAQVGGLLDDDGYHSKDGTRLGDPLLSEPDSTQAAAGDPTTSYGSDSGSELAEQRATQGATDAAEETDATQLADSNDVTPPTDSVPAQPAAPKRRAPPLVEERSQGTKPLAKQAIWAVQLASFASPVNATALRDRLLGDGYEAWTSTARREAGIRTRVAIGPLLDRGDAERMRDLVSGRYNVSAIVVHMEP